MPRTQKVVRSAEATGDIVDTVLLKYEDRIKQQGFVFGGKGTCVEFDFAAPPLLRTDDLLLLDDGRLIEVVAEVEPVLEVREKDFATAARLILAFGNRHVPVQILANRLRQQCAKLAALPGILGRPRPELRPDIRSFPFRGYVISFRYVGDAFEVVAILEGHRDVDMYFRESDN